MSDTASAPTTTGPDPRRWITLSVLILSVIIGSNLSRAVTGNSPLVPTLCACLVLVLLHRLLAYAAASSPLPGRWLKGTASRLVTDGEVDHQALRRHGIGDGDLEQAFRCAGARDAGEVEAAWLERDGSISVFLIDKTKG